MRSTFFIAILIFVLAAQGEEESYSVSDYSDCAEVEVDFDGDSKIYTAAEMTAMMDKGLYEALSRFDRCQTSAQPKGSSTELDTSSSTSVGQAGVGENGDSETGTVNSTASSSVSGVGENGDSETGTVNSTASSLVSGVEVSNANANNTGNSATSKTSKADNKALLDNGKPPSDIPSSDNDSVFQAQIRKAAMAEQDTERKAALWEEYRKLKGIPSVKEN